MVVVRLLPPLWAAVLLAPSKAVVVGLLLLLVQRVEEVPLLLREHALLLLEVVGLELKLELKPRLLAVPRLELAPFPQLVPQVVCPLVSSPAHQLALLRPPPLPRLALVALEPPLVPIPAPRLVALRNLLAATPFLPQVVLVLLLPLLVRPAVALDLQPLALGVPQVNLPLPEEAESLKPYPLLGRLPPLPLEAAAAAVVVVEVKPQAVVELRPSSPALTLLLLEVLEGVEVVVEVPLNSQPLLVLPLLVLPAVEEEVVVSSPLPPVLLEAEGVEGAP